MNTRISIQFELGHKDIQEWLVFSIPLLAAALIAVCISYIYYINP